MNDCLKKRGLNVGQGRRMVYDRSKWWEFIKLNDWGIAPGDEPLTLMRCYSCRLSQLYETLRDGG